VENAAKRKQLKKQPRKRLPRKRKDSLYSKPGAHEKRAWFLTNRFYL